MPGYSKTSFLTLIYLGGPFEYWLNRSRSQDVGDGSILTECIDMLQGGRLPPLLRKLSRAAAAFPEDDR